MSANEIRQTFFDFFAGKEHKIVRSAPVVPIDDPTLLFTNAGMNQFKGIFLGVDGVKFPRVADTQKCIRVSGKHNDLEEVGRDTYHHTFFEMLGNWSFGDYYKKEAIIWAWELLTDVWQLPKKALWATVFEDDDEAEALWKSETDVTPSQVLRFDKKDNFWEMGETGPCGPCSEIHIDLGESNCDKSHIKGHVCAVNGGCARYIELWNLVFIQFNRNETGALDDLPQKHVDTGMGFERIVAVLENKASNYDTTVFQPLIDAISDISGIDYANSDGVAHRVIADHVRALSFAIADGAMPSNEGRGYVLRRLLRRAARYGRNLEMHEPFIHKLVAVLAESMGGVFPEIVEKRDYAVMVIKAEEESFGQTLDRGLEIFHRVAEDLKANKSKTFPGEAVFQLYDTYGFPVDLTQLMAEEMKLDLDMAGFTAEMDKQKKRAKEARQVQFEVKDFFADGQEPPNSEFVGYGDLEAKVVIVAHHDGEFILDRTPFYGESGGQVGDTGVVRDAGDNLLIRVTDVQKSGTRIVHFGEVEHGDISDYLGKELVAQVDVPKRKSTARNHTATHLLHKALRMTLGEHVNQAGSLVAPDRLRFDFTHFEQVSKEKLNQIETIVNEQIRANLPVVIHFKAFDEAKRMGAVALFGEKYGDEVRVVQMGDFSMELCGGTHLQATGEIGYFRLTHEGSVAAGVRRIEAVTGEAADELIRHEKALLSDLMELSGAGNDDLLPRVEQLIEERKALQRQLDEVVLETSVAKLEPLMASAADLDGFKLIATRIEPDTPDNIKKLGDFIRSKLGSGVAVLGTLVEDKPFLLCVVTDDLVKSHHLKAGDIVRQLAPHIGGGGGGRPHMAQAGGKDPSKLDFALEKSASVVEDLIKSREG